MRPDPATDSRFSDAWKLLTLAHPTAQLRPRDTLRTPRPLQPGPAAPSGQARTTLRCLESRPGQPAEIELKDKLGEGGMGVIHLAQQVPLGREVAVKSLRPLSDEPDGQDDLLREAWVTGMLEHPNVVPIYTLGADEQGRPVMVMRRIEGVSWQAVLRGEACLPACHQCPIRHEAGLESHLAILLQVCNALAFAHSRGILHCDLKPDNVMIGTHGEVYLLDWGISVSLRPDAQGRLPLARELQLAVGTPAFMSPEQARGEGARFSPATDVYGLGAILHQLITGEPRHPGDELLAVLYHAHLSEPYPYPPTLCPLLGEICNKACAAEPEDRYPDAAAFRQRLEVYLEQRRSMALTFEANERLAELESLLGDLDRTAPEEELRGTQRIYGLFGQCRFGYGQARRLWPENPYAAAGLQRAVEAMVGQELDQGAPEAAAALLTELPEPRPELATRVERLAGQRARQQADQRQLGQLRHEADVAVGSRLRSRFAFALALLVVAIPLPLALLDRLGLYTPPPGLGVAAFAGFGLLLAGAILLARRSLLANRANRSIVGTLALVVLARGAHRAIAALLAIPLQQVVLFDLSLLFVALAALALTVDRRLGWAAGVYAVALGVGLLVPGAALFLLSAGNLVALAAVGWVWRGAGATGGR